jgi:hypothetical protein
MHNKCNVVGMVIATYFLRQLSQVLQSYYNNDNINIYAAFTYLWLCLYPLFCEYKIWSQILMKEK